MSDSSHIFHNDGRRLPPWRFNFHELISRKMNFRFRTGSSIEITNSRFIMITFT